jgi:hypothetical protein
MGNLDFPTFVKILKLNLRKKRHVLLNLNRILFLRKKENSPLVQMKQAHQISFSPKTFGITQPETHLILEL